MLAKAALYLAMGEAGMTKVQLARRPGCDEKEVRRMLDPRHPTKLPRIKEAREVFGNARSGRFSRRLLECPALSHTSTV
jgi:antitoxin HicB